jgi:hypothetical protein
MTEATTKASTWKKTATGLLLMLSLAATGCTVDVGGQTLPSPYYLTDDIQYFPPGPEFKLANEAAALEAYRVEAEAIGQ